MVEVVNNRELNPYKHSAAVDLLMKRHMQGSPLRIAFFDIDSTMTGDPNDQQSLRYELERQGYAVVFVTSRTEEMGISADQWQKSVDLGTPMRPRPKLQGATGPIDYIRGLDTEFFLGFADQVHAFTGLYDPHIMVGSTGTEIMIRDKNGGYHTDEAFQEQFKADSNDWRTVTTGLIKRLNSTISSLYGANDIYPAKYAEIEDISNYESGSVDVAPPDFRIQLNFYNLKSQEFFMELFMEQISSLQQTDSSLNETSDKATSIIKQLRITEDGKSADERFQIYVAPHGGSKVRAVEHVIKSICQALDTHGVCVNRSDFEVLFAGDSHPDLPMGLYGALGTKTTLLIVGGSRLTGREHLYDKFATKNFRAIKQRLIKTDRAGVYTVKLPNINPELNQVERQIIIGNATYPNTIGPQTILRHLTETAHAETLR